METLASSDTVCTAGRITGTKDTSELADGTSVVLRDIVITRGVAIPLNGRSGDNCGSKEGDESERELSELHVGLSIGGCCCCMKTDASV
jgi:hypothetical protein